MSFLSNWRSADTPSATSGAGPIRCRPAAAGEVYPAMRLVLSTGARRAGDEQVVDFLRYALARGIDVNELWIAERNGRLLFATLPIPSAGRTLLLLAPGRFASAEQAEGASALIEQVVDRFATSGTHLAQVLLEPSEQEAIHLYAAHEFRPLAELIYLQTTVRRTAAFPELPDGHRWVSYSADTHGRFSAAITASYKDSLDCPALTGMRDVEDTIAGHRATGEFDPGLWFLLCRGDEPRAVVLLAPATPSDAMELVYLGIPPSSRGQGIGDLLMRQALAATAARRTALLTLAVDSQNAPALKLYYRHGLRRIASKVALMRDMRAHGARDRVATPAPATTGPHPAR